MLAALLAASAGACGDDSTGPDRLAACSDAVTVAVGPGTTPDISWTPRCGAALLAVEEVGASSGLEIKWHVLALESLLEPPIRYGVAPDGAVDIIALPPTPLVSGRTYRVTVHGRGAGLSFVELGSATFTP
jgi:hypothetical protein